MAGEPSGTITYNTAQPLKDAIVRALETVHLNDARQMLSVQAKLELDSRWLHQRLLTRAVLPCQALWLPGRENTLWLGFGTAAEVSVPREEPLTHLAEQFRRQLPNWLCAACTTPPRWFGGFAFAANRVGDPWQAWPAAKLMLPVFQLELPCTDEGFNLSILPETLATVVTYSCTVQEGDSVERILQQFEQDFANWQRIEPPHEVFREGNGTAVAALDQTAWVNAVRDSAQAIANHELRKVVLARLEVCRVPSAGTEAWLPRLLATSGSATAFAVAHHEDLFIGASPERLVRVADGEVSVDCLAGSRPRGQTDAMDAELGRALLDSPKDQAEHRVVVDWVRSKLAPLTQSLELPNQPRLKRMETVQHLHTPAQGRLYDGVDVLDVAFALHPTPAVAGDPADRAQHVIARYEPVDRGWYAGSVGWVDAAGNGEFVVALRSALVQGEQAILYAGAGIMADSDPLQEWQETGWKLRPMRRVMGCDEELGDHA